MAKINYLSFAENDYKYFEKDCKDGRVANYMAAQAQNICEKYLKHIVDTYVFPNNAKEQGEKVEILRTHNLNKLIKFIRNTTNCTFSKDAVIKLNSINGFYFSTRYPGEDSFFVDKEDISLCREAVDLCRNEVLNYCKRNKEAVIKNIEEIDY